MFLAHQRQKPARKQGCGRHCHGVTGPRVVVIALISIIVTVITNTSLATPNPRLKQIELSKPLTVHWRYDSEQTINLTPASDGDRVYLPLSAGQMVSLRTDTGQLIWKSDIGGELSASPVADERGVYVASESRDTSGQELITSGALRLLSRDTGVTLWVRSLPTAPGAALALNVDTIFGGASDGRVYALRKTTGEVLWAKQIDSRVSSQLTLVGSRLYIGSEFGNVYALDQRTGKLIWHYQTRSAIRGRIAVSDGLVYFGSADGYVYAVSEDKGRKRWRTRTGAGVQSVLSVHYGLLASSFDNFVYSFNLHDGNTLWKRQLAGRLAAEPLATFDGVLFTPLSGDTGIVLSLKDGKQLNSLPLGEESSSTASPILAGDVLLVTTRHGLLAFAHPKGEGR